MSNPQTELRRKRSSAKGCITRVGKQIDRVTTTDPSDLDLDQLKKFRAGLDKHAQAYQEYHEAVTEEEDLGDNEVFQNELLDQENVTHLWYRRLLDLENYHDAFLALRELETVLEDLEKSSVGGSYATRDAQLEVAEKMNMKLLMARSKGTASKSVQLTAARDQAVARLQALQRMRDEERPVKDSGEASPKEIHVSTPSLRLDLPVFDGTLLGWKDFYQLFSAVMDRQTRLTDHEKNCHLIKAMGTPEAKEKAKAATTYTSTYAAAVDKLKESYELNRVLLAHHLADYLQPEQFRDEKRDLVTFLERIEKNLRGIKLAKGFTAEQLMTTHAEALMSPALTKEWRKSSCDHDVTPPIDLLLEFLRRQIKASPDVPLNKRDKDPPARPKHSQKSSGRTVLHTRPTSDKCTICDVDHMLYMCAQFREKTPQQRKELVRSANLCYNCLSSRHRSTDCSSRQRCKDCGGKHHTLIHLPRTSSGQEGDVETVTVNLTDRGSRRGGEWIYALPCTAIVRVQAKGLQQKARAQLDSGATISLITRKLANTIRASKIPDSAMKISGIGGVEHSPHRVEVVLLGRQGEEVVVTPHVVDQIPHSPSRTDVGKVHRLPLARDLTLSDPGYTSSARIDLLLSSRKSNACFRDGVRYSKDRELKAENTIFGWTIHGGDTRENQEEGSHSTCLHISAEEEEDPERLLRRFWELEPFPEEETTQTSEELRAVQHFGDTVRRDTDGRYRVSLPRKLPTPELGKSRDNAMRRYLSTERSLKKKGSWEDFREAVADYGRMGHSELVPLEHMRRESKFVYYMPMHAVFKTCSTTTKLRAVCDASAETANGVSLNHTLLPGPSLYPLLTTVISRFRTHNIGMTADISKMFREVGLNSDETDYHRYLHRDDEGKLQDWRMTRLTFGVTSSPYLATQVLRQLAQDHRKEYPTAAAIVESSFYVDDCLTGADDLEHAEQIREELNELLKRGCMTLRKWRASSPTLLMSIPEELRETSDLKITSHPGEHTKTLGLHWSTTDDSLHVATPEVDVMEKATKRRVASAVARVFDVLGWFTPSTLPAKVLLQEAWSLKLGWDQLLPEPLQQRWFAWVKELHFITTHPVPRRFGLSDRVVVTKQLHGFSDASTLAYGGVVYLRTFHSDVEVTVDLVASKTKVAPLKQRTVPRLELCGALVLSELLHQVADDLKVPMASVFAWSDSSAVLGWLNGAPSRLTVFVANRVNKIAALVNSSQWRYVTTETNPADLLSRGVSPRELTTTLLWWEGPPWLKMDPARWPRRPDINLNREIPELRPSVLSITPALEELGVDISTFDKLVRVFAWVWRFRGQCTLEKKHLLSTHLTLKELRVAKTLLLRHSQRTSYAKEFEMLEGKRPLPAGHTLSALSPYIDEDGLLRVGGRLQRAELASSTAHPLIMSISSHVVVLLVRRTHQVLLHAGPSTVMATLAHTYHIPRIKALLRKISRSCVPCQKAYARTAKQLMGELPASRTQPARPFSIVGLDYAGPLLTKRGNPRKPTMVKTFICIFVCFSSRAVHIEVVSDLSTPAFLAALRRFVARRGCPAEVYSDNGTNFKGAHAELRRMIESLNQQETREAVVQWAAWKNIEWHFSPARAPHFGGLWEAAVKSLKTLMKKTVGEKALTYEELTTLVVEAEAVINSRPLIPLDSPSDDGVAPLTPGHFLVGGPLMALPSLPDVTSKPTLLRKWNLMERMVYDFRKRWKTEYLLHMQRRGRWKRPNGSLQIGDVVLMKDSDSFQRSWPMGRVTQVYPGEDGHVRVVDVLMQGRTFRRPIHKLVRLLGEEDEAISPRGEDVRAHG